VFPACCAQLQSLTERVTRLEGDKERMYASKTEAENRLAALESELASTFQELEKARHTGTPQGEGAKTVSRLAFEKIRELQEETESLSGELKVCTAAPYLRPKYSYMLAAGQAPKWTVEPGSSNWTSERHSSQPISQGFRTASPEALLLPLIQVQEEARSTLEGELQQATTQLAAITADKEALERRAGDLAGQVWGWTSGTSEGILVRMCRLYLMGQGWGWRAFPVWKSAPEIAENACMQCALRQPSCASL
jgi:hypothetical protein